jgi:hypothetical protein
MCRSPEPAAGSNRLDLVRTGSGRHRSTHEEATCRLICRLFATEQHVPVAEAYYECAVITEFATPTDAIDLHGRELIVKPRRNDGSELSKRERA